MQFLNHADLNQNQLLNAVLHIAPSADPASPVEGQIWIRGDNKAVKVRRGTASDIIWTGAHLLAIGGVVVDSINTDTGVHTIRANTDNTTIDTNVNSQLQIKAGGITNAHISASAAIAFSKLASLTSGRILVGNASNVPTAVSVTGDVTISNGGVTTIGARKVDFEKFIASAAAGLSVIGRSVASAGSFAEITASANDAVLMRYNDSIVFRSVANAQIAADAAIAWTKLSDTTQPNRVLGKMGIAGEVGEVRVIISSESLASLNSDVTLVSSKAIKDYVDTQIMQGTTPSFKGEWSALSQTVFPGDAQTKPGDYWYVSAEGTIQGKQLRVHDVIIARVAAPTNTSALDYVILESDKDMASETSYGWVKMATQADVTSRVGGAVAVTPYRMVEYFESMMSASAYEEVIGDGVLTQFNIVHNKGTKKVHVAVYESGAGEQLVYPNISIIDTNTVRVSMSAAPGTGQYRVVVLG